MNIDTIKHILPWGRWRSRKGFPKYRTPQQQNVPDPKAELIADLKQSLLDAQSGKTFPFSEL